VLGVGLGPLVRNQVVAVAAGLVRMRVDAILPDALQRPGLGRWMPEGAASAPHRPHTGRSSPGPPGGAAA
jgi:hypothetical protein